MRRIAQLVLVSVTGVILTGACLFGYLYGIAGPDIDISSTQDSAGVQVDTRFLGEYHLGLNRLLISSESGKAIIVLHSEGAEIPNLFQLVPGINRLQAFSQGGAGTALEPFSLEPGPTYSIEVCGNNGFGRVRCSSEDFTL